MARASRHRDARNNPERHLLREEVLTGCPLGNDLRPQRGDDDILFNAREHEAASTSIFDRGAHVVVVTVIDNNKPVVEGIRGPDLQRAVLGLEGAGEDFDVGT
jgi:hypothetical protein